MTGLSQGQDVLSTLNGLRALGFEILQSGLNIEIHGQGFHRWKLNGQVLDCGNSGTTARHLMGLLAGGQGSVTLVGDDSLSGRPMRRIADPLKQMGAEIDLSGAGTLPAKISGRVLRALDHRLEVPSAQVKSSLILAAANSGVMARLSGRLEGRDHTERLIPFFGGRIQITEDGIELPPQSDWSAVDYCVPRDPSAMANWIAMALLNQRSLVLEDVLLNPSRLGFVHVLQSMGAKISIEILEDFPEPRGRVVVEPSELHALENSTESASHFKIASSAFIDEAPLLALLSSQAEGVTVIPDLSELRFKECDRYAVTAQILRELGVDIACEGDSWIIQGRAKLQAAKLQTHNDHRMAMLGLVAGSQVEVVLDSVSSLKVSDPQMWESVC